MSSSEEVKIYSPKKLIEVALPLDDINVAAAREKSIRHGHPSTLHLWWARRPLAAARAVIFAQMVNDPGYQQDSGFKYGVNKKEAEIKREKLFQIIRDLVKWENTNNEEVLNRAREAIKESWRETCQLNGKHPQAAELFNPEQLPAFHDPFAGGGAIPLEAQRLGLESYASDLNPVAVMINKGMIEIPPKFADRAPVGPVTKSDKKGKDRVRPGKQLDEDWSGAKGLAEDVRRYGHWMREEAFKRIGHLYPKVLITNDMISERPDLEPYADEELTVIAWLWARTIKSPNPAFSHVDVPLVSSFLLSSKKDRDAWVEPVLDGETYKFKVRFSQPGIDVKNGTKLGRGAKFNCIFSSTSIDSKYIYSESQAGKLGQRLMAVVAEGKRGRVYLSPIAGMEETALSANPEWSPEALMPENPRWFSPPKYGMKSYGDLFTKRQLVALNTFSNLVLEARVKVISDAKAAGMNDDKLTISEGGAGATAYADAIAVYLGFAVDKGANYWSSICAWHSGRDTITSTFGRQAIPMVWDFAEANPLSTSSGNFLSGINQASKVIEKSPNQSMGKVFQAAAQLQLVSKDKVISTDPPYYDNIGYADLSDYLYVWMRRSLRTIYPELFSTMAVPKAEELVATPYRHGSKKKAEDFFMDGMTQAIQNLAEKGHPAFPVTIFYAFKQSETNEGSTSNTGWETFLEAVIQSGFSIDGTWPMKTEYTGNLKKSINVLASSVVLVCQKRGKLVSSISRREFQRELREQMPEALEAMIGGETGTTPIAPVDLAQAAIGPGMAIYSKYEAVLNQDGSKMSVHDALILINRAITDYLNPDSGNFDADTLFCDDWFSQFGWGEGLFGEADTLARAKGTSVDGVHDAGVIESGGGKVRLLKWSEYPSDWDPKTDSRTPIWEVCHQLIRVLNQEGESASGGLLARMPDLGEPIRQLAYHLYTLCERKKWADDARAYNELIGSWHAIVTASHDAGHRDEQLGMGF
jgi:putative DNA methylase